MHPEDWWLVPHFTNDICLHVTGLTGFERARALDPSLEPCCDEQGADKELALRKRREAELEAGSDVSTE